MSTQRTDPGRLRAKARRLFISQATMDDFLSWATPRQAEAADRLFRNEPDNRETAKRARLMRRAKFPVPKGLDGYDFSDVRLPDGYTRDEMLSLDFARHAQDLVFYGKTGRGKTHLAIALGRKACRQGVPVRFHTAAGLVMRLLRANTEGKLDREPQAIAKARMIVIDELGYVPIDEEGGRLLSQVVANAYETQSIVYTTNIESGG